MAALGEPPRLFTEEVLREMGNNAEHPLIFALSRPEGISECTAKEAYDATEGRCVFASGCPVEPFVDAHTGKRIAPRPSTSAFVFPDSASGSRSPRRPRARGPRFPAAAEAVASLVTEADLEEGARCTPGWRASARASAHVAAKVKAKCHEMQGRGDDAHDGEEDDPRAARPARQKAHVQSAVSVLRERASATGNGRRARVARVARVGGSASLRGELKFY